MNEKVNEPSTDWSSADACVRAARADVDSVPRVSLRVAWRDLSCKLSGPEGYCRVAYAPGTGDVTTEWPDAERLPARGFRAAERRATRYAEVPVGTLVQTFARDVWRGGRGRCSVGFGVVTVRDGAAHVVDCEHRTLRKRPVYEVHLPTGEVAFIERRA